VRDSVWNGRPFIMVKDDGTAKGFKTILAERGLVNFSHLKAGQMREILSLHSDFIEEKTQVEHFVEDRGL